MRYVENNAFGNYMYSKLNDICHICEINVASLHFTAAWLATISETIF